MKKQWIVFILLIVLSLPNVLQAQVPFKPRDPAVSGSQTFAIVLGISKYKHVRPLTYADKDALLFKDYLKSPAGGSLKEENIFALLNEQALNSTFWTKGFQWLKLKNLRKGDRLFIYLAGHGDAIDQDEFFFLSYDCNPAGDKNNYLAGGAIQLYNLKKKIANETAKGVDVFFIMDACRSNELPGGTEGQNFLNTAVSEKKAGEVIMLATGAGQESLEDASIGNGQGLFTYYLVDGLTGMADTQGTPDNKVTFGELKVYIDKNVPTIAQQRFKRKQDPYLCCNEASEKVIGQVDAAYLQKWLNFKKQTNRRGGGSSFSGDVNYRPIFYKADTLLQETYNAFFKAIKNNNLTGSNESAEAYFTKLNKKFPDNPYTLDAKSTLADELVKYAQGIVNNYLSCTELSANQKRENYEAGIRLEKAMALAEDADFANSLKARMLFLKASGDFGNAGQNGSIANGLQFAYNALAAEPNGAYIQNRLALLHFENNNLDSARYYAEKAARTAPKWVCALATLTMVNNKSTPTNEQKPEPKTKKSPFKNGYKKFQFGGVLGGGISDYQITTVTPTANDTLRSASVTGRTKFELGITGQFNVSEFVSIRPSVVVSSENTDVVYEKRGLTGGSITEIVPVKTTSIYVPIPIVIRFSSKKIAPYLMAAPVFSFVNQGASSATKLAIKSTDILADAGLGVDISLLKSHLIISPELKISRGLTDVKEQKDVSYSRIINKLNKQSYTFSVFIRAR
jgi:tetratricopeptide (TPR) repeat protein